MLDFAGGFAKEKFAFGVPVGESCPVGIGRSPLETILRVNSMPLSVRSRLLLGAVVTATWSPCPNSFAWMHDKDIYKKFLEIEYPWNITDMQLDDSNMTVSAAIMFHLDGLGLHPQIASTHTDS